MSPAPFTPSAYASSPRKSTASKRAPGITGVLQQIAEVEDRMNESENKSNMALELVSHLQTSIIKVMDQAKEDAIKV